MTSYGFDADTSGQSLCAVKEWQDKQIAVGILLFTYGTVPHPLSVCPDAGPKVLQITKALIQAEAEKIVNHDGSTDIQYAAARLSDSLAAANKRICELNALLGQGIYVGGVIVYLSTDQYLAMPFGGAVVYTWNGYYLQPIAQDKSDNLIRDALGSKEAWECNCWRARLQERTSIFCMTEALLYEDAVSEKLHESMKFASHPNTASMLLRRELEHSTQPPSAVLEFKN